MKDQLVFNTAVPSDSDNVGAYVLAGNDGSQIGYQTVNSIKWLNTSSVIFDGVAGNPIGSTASTGTVTATTVGLNVFVVGGEMLDVGIADKSGFTYGTSIEQPVGGVYQDASPTLSAGQTGAARLTQYRAFHENSRDALGVENFLGTANTAAQNSSHSVNNTVSQLDATPLSRRKRVMIQNTGTLSVYIGYANTVTSSGATQGVKVPAGDSLPLEVGPTVALWAIAGTAASQTIILSEFS